MGTRAVEAMLVLFLLVSTPLLGRAQDVEPDGEQPADAPANSRTLVAGSLGLGLGTLDVGGLVSLGIGTSAGDFVIRSAGTSDWEFFGKPESVSDVAVLYGRRRSSEVGWMRIAAGPALVEAEEAGDVAECVLFFCDYERIRTTTVGLAAQADAVWAVARWFGLGVGVFGNVNSARSFAGVALTVSLGAVR